MPSSRRGRQRTSALLPLRLRPSWRRGSPMRSKPTNTLKLIRPLSREEKAQSRSVYGKARASGEITPGPCAVCGSLKTDGHHFDYLKPLEVVWLCRKHHAAVHRAMDAEGRRKCFEYLLSMLPPRMAVVLNDLAFYPKSTPKDTAMRLGSKVTPSLLNAFEQLYRKRILLNMGGGSGLSETMFSVKKAFRTKSLQSLISPSNPND